MTQQPDRPIVLRAPVKATDLEHKHSARLSPIGKVGVELAKLDRANRAVRAAARLANAAADEAERAKQEADDRRLVQSIRRKR